MPDRPICLDGSCDDKRKTCHFGTTNVNGELLAARIPGAKLQIIPGVGHLVPMEAPRETFTAIQQFFAEG